MKPEKPDTSDKPVPADVSVNRSGGGANTNPTQPKKPTGR